MQNAPPHVTQMLDALRSFIGEPASLDGARQLARDDRYQFQWWALSLVRARPYGGEAGGKTGKKGSDRGIDGLITFIDDATGKIKRVIVQVKSGKVKSGDVRDLAGTLQREGAAIGVFLTLEPPTAEMTREAVAAGFYESPGWGTTHPRLQLLTVGDLLAGRARVDMPPSEMTFKAAGRAKDPGAAQGKLFE
jgi:site-specific DNA-methyltransferase (adenine-specific)